MSSHRRCQRSQTCCCWHASCRSGFARFTNCRFSMRREDITNTFIHLTNVAIQKHAPTFDRDKGMKWPVRNLRLFLNTRHGACACMRLDRQRKARVYACTQLDCQ